MYSRKLININKIWLSIIILGMTMIFTTTKSKIVKKQYYEFHCLC